MRNNGMIIAGLVIVLLAVTLASLAFIMPGPGIILGGAMMNGTWMNGMMGGYRMPGDGFGGYMLFWPVFGALVLGAGVLAMLWLVRHGGPALLSTSVRESPLDVLKLRYARGEITKEQYEQMQHTINI